MNGDEFCKRVPICFTSKSHFDTRLARQYINSIKVVVMMGIWKGLCLEWLTLKDNDPLNVQDSHLVSYYQVLPIT